MTDTPEPGPIPDPPASPTNPETQAPDVVPTANDQAPSTPPDVPATANDQAPSTPPDVPATANDRAPSAPGAAPPWSPPLVAPTGPATPARQPGLRFRPAVLLVALLAVAGMVGAIVVFGEDGGGSRSVTQADGASSGSTSGGDTPGEVVTISDPSALAPPGGVPVPPSYSGAVLEWKTDQSWSAVLVWYYGSFPIDKMALEPASFGETTQGGRPIGESHYIIFEGTPRAPGLSPYLAIEEDYENPTGSVVRYFTYD